MRPGSKSASAFVDRKKVAALMVLLASGGLVFTTIRTKVTHAIGTKVSLRHDDVCHTHYHADYMGDMAVVWGSKFIVSDAGECCEACKAHARVCGQKDGNGKVFHEKAPHPCGHEYEKACNMWVFCEGGGPQYDNRCFSFDIHNHTRGECWLKRQADPTKPTVGDENSYPAKMRAAKREIWPWAVEEKLWPWEMPEKVHWISGVLTDPPLATVRPEKPINFVRWCDKNGPCEELA